MARKGLRLTMAQERELSEEYQVAKAHKDRDMCLLIQGLRLVHRGFRETDAADTIGVGAGLFRTGFIDTGIEGFPAWSKVLIQVESPSSPKNRGLTWRQSLQRVRKPRDLIPVSGSPPWSLSLLNVATASLTARPRLPGYSMICDSPCSIPPRNSPKPTRKLSNNGARRSFPASKKSG